MSSFANVLVPYDGSEAAGRAFKTALDIAAPKARVTLLQVGEELRVADPSMVVAERMAGVIRTDEEREQVVARYWENVEKSLEEFAATVDVPAEKELEIVCKVDRGNPATVIAEYAHYNDVDIVVMGRRGLNAMRSMLGSVSQRVAHETDVPLLLVK